MPRETLFDQTLHALEWSKLLECLASQAHSALGAEFCRALPLADTCELAQIRLQETTEMVMVAEGSLPSPVLNCPDIRSAIDRAEKGACLEAKELRRIAKVLSLMSATQRCLSAQARTVPRLFAYVNHLDNLSFLQSEIDQCISEDGDVLDHATSALYDALQEAQGLKLRMRQRLESMMTSTKYREALQEPYFAQRENRYVLPIKVEAQHQIDGIVHDVSSSGLTVFLEPRELIELNNRIKVAELKVAREIQRILLDLTSLVSGHAQAIRSSLEALTVLDSIGAKARLSRAMHARPVQLYEDGHIRLLKACHPLLVLSCMDVVANDIVFGKDHKVLVISGPNTGGKTVNLKLLGLYSLMVRAGLHLPCGDGSEMGFFAETYADIGDTQDLAQNLSSFSAHLTKIIELLDLAQAGHVQGPVLVLLDEVIGSTDPLEGAALAEAILYQFAEYGFKVVVTTHYNSLKTLALSTPGFLNASLEFDVARLTPTYRLIEGIPGGSSALEIAGRLGMNPSILKRASDIIQKQDHQLDRIFSDLQGMHYRLRKEVEEAEHMRRLAAAASAEAQERVSKLRAAEQEEFQKIKKKLREESHKVRSEIRQIIETLKQEKTLVHAKAAAKRMAEIDAQLSRTISDTSHTIPLDSLESGALVEISHLGTIGRLLEPTKGKKRVRLKVGDSEISVGVEHLVGRSQNDQPDRFFSSSVKKRNVSLVNILPKEREASPNLTASLLAFTTIDLRGFRTEEALTVLTSRLDEAIRTPAKSVTLIHGHGSGRLKQAIRHYLSRSPYVESFRPGEEGQGGDGVTIVELR